jgi:hypothetical protein
VRKISGTKSGLQIVRSFQMAFYIEGFAMERIFRNKPSPRPARFRSELMGNGLKSVPMNKLMEGAAKGAFQIAMATLPLEKIAEAWQAPGEPRMVVTIP